MRELLVAIELACCPGQPVSEAIQVGWRHYLELAPEAQEQLWTVVIPGVVSPEDPDNATRAESLVGQIDAPIDQVAAAMQSCGFLLTQASANNVDDSTMHRDFLLLSGGETSTGVEMAAQVVRECRQRVRESLLQTTLRDHGKVLTTLDWRVDQVAASNRGTQFDSSVVFLTLGYREGRENQRISLQVTPGGIRDLRAFLEQFDGNE